MEATGDSMTTNADNDALVQAPLLFGMAGMFLAGHDPKDPLVAPIHADFNGIAPLYIQVGGYETLLDDAKRVAAAAERDGVDVTLEVFPEMQHVFQLGAGNVPESDDAIAKIRPVDVSSQGVARKLGMTPEREVEFHGLPHLVLNQARFM